MSALAILHALAPYAPTAFVAVIAPLSIALVAGFSVGPVRAALGWRV